MSAPLGTRPLRLQLGRWLDVVLVSDAEQIRWLNQHPAVDRMIDPKQSWLHRVLDQRLREDLSFGGRRLQVFLSRLDQERIELQQKLAERLDALRGLPGAERDRIAEYVAGRKGGEIGEVVQQWCGRLFFPYYHSDAERYAAGRTIAEWPARPPWSAWMDRVSGRLDRDKDLLASAAQGDLQCVHALAIGTGGLTRTVENMRAAARDPAKRSMAPDQILRECLSPPPAVVRGVVAEFPVPFLKRPLTPRTVIVFLIARAFATSGELDVAFMGDQWSACPAKRVLPEMLSAVWRAAQREEAAGKDVMARINVISRLWNRGVS